MMTSKYFRALEDGRIITKISIYGYEGNLIKTLPLNQAMLHMCVLNSNSKDYNFTMEEIKYYIQMGFADAYATTIIQDGNPAGKIFHAIKYIDLVYGKLIRQRKLKEFGLKRIG